MAGLTTGDRATELADAPPLRVAIAGAGAMGRVHVRVVSARPHRARVVAISDPDPAALESASRLVDARPGLYASLQQMLIEERPDVVHVCTPPATHVSLARLAIDHGCHVYVEKPVAQSDDELEPLLGAAAARSRLVCPGHQLLFTRPARAVLARIPRLGGVMHAESFFAFRRNGGGWRRDAHVPDEAQLLDVLPHGIYPLLAALERAEPYAALEIESVQLGAGGTVHALVRRGRVCGTLVVTLAGRPVESYLRLVGTGGTVHADFVRGGLLELQGEGASAVSKLLNPVRTAGQLLAGTAGGVARRLLAGEDYAGLGGLIEAFHRAIREGRGSPLGDEHVRGTVRLQQRVAERLGQAGGACFPLLRMADARTRRSAPASAMAAATPAVAVTGGAGFLGAETVCALLRGGAAVRVVSRRVPPAWERVPDVEYVAADLAGPVAEDVFAGCAAVVHCAAETSGGWDAHERNSVRATENVLRAAARAGVRRIVHVSSLAVVDRTVASRRAGPLLSDTRARRLGPYVWGKAEAERRARSLSSELGLELSVLRPAAVVDAARFDPPGRLGRRLGSVYLAVGGPEETMAVVERGDAARAIARAATAATAPATVDLIASPPLTRRALVDRLKHADPGVRVLWLRRSLFTPLAGVATWLQRALPGQRRVVDVAAIFAREEWATPGGGRTVEAAQLPGD